MGFHSQCHVLTPHTQTHTHTATTCSQWNVSLAQISTKQGCYVSATRHRNVVSSAACRRAHTPTRSVLSERASGAHFVPPGKRRVTRLSITDLRVTGEDAAVRTRAAAFTHRGNPVKWPPGCSHMGRLPHEIWIFSCVCSRLE